MTTVRKIDLLLAEIGSTTTVMNAFTDLDSEEPIFLGQGQAATTVEAGDVSLGLAAAQRALEEELGERLEAREVLATSSAAGGLRMTVHGLVYDMTVRAAKEAALGSGAVIKLITAGRLRRSDLAKIVEIAPKMLFLAGGTDFGERETALFNYEALMSALPRTPLVYAGNCENHEELRLLAEAGGHRLYLCENVYPQLDQLNIEPARQLVHEAFEENITASPGMEKIRERVSGHILPTPGAVMEAAILLSKLLGDLLVFDVGGATTDLHSVTDGSPTIREIQTQAEPRAKRTVEGDLGLFVNRESLLAQMSAERRATLPAHWEELSRATAEIPTTPESYAFLRQLTAEACHVALERHAGRLVELYGPTGRQTLAKGKDLSQIKYVIGTGGALTRLGDGEAILKQALTFRRRDLLLPEDNLSFYIDRDYNMAALGVLAKAKPLIAARLLLRSLGIELSREEILERLTEK